MPSGVYIRTKPSRSRPGPNKGKGLAAKWLKDRAAHTGTDCLWWPYGKDTKGYGSLGYNGNRYLAHRFMCELAHGPAPTSEHHAAHSCGNGHLGCVNPLHLSWKTPAENQLDRRLHGTALTSKHGNRSLRTPEQTAEIRRAIGTDTVTNLAKRFKTSRRTIERIRAGHEPKTISMTPRDIMRRAAEKRRREQMVP